MCTLTDRCPHKLSIRQVMVHRFRDTHQRQTPLIVGLYAGCQVRSRHQQHSLSPGMEQRTNLWGICRQRTLRRSVAFARHPALDGTLCGTQVTQQTLQQCCVAKLSSLLPQDCGAALSVGCLTYSLLITILRLL
jgi:hypothetical protein